MKAQLGWARVRDDSGMWVRVRDDSGMSGSGSRSIRNNLEHFSKSKILIAPTQSDLVARLVTERDLLFVSADMATKMFRPRIRPGAPPHSAGRHCDMTLWRTTQAFLQCQIQRGSHRTDTSTFRRGPKKPPETSADLHLKSEHCALTPK